MARVEYADGTIVWRRSLPAKIVWAVGVGAAVAWFVLADGLDLEIRAPGLLVTAGMSVYAWCKVWHPHIAATRDGYRPNLRWLTKGESDADDAVALIEAKALFADRV